MKNKMMVLLSMFLFIEILSFSNTLDFTPINGTGKFIHAKGGTMANSNGKPFDDVKGTLYVSGDFGENNYIDIIDSAEILKTLKFSGSTSSESPLYTTKAIVDPFTNSLNFKLTRIKFTNNIIDNNKLAIFLELNYYNSNEIYKNNFYNGLKKLDSKSKINLTLNSIFGITIFPIITNQTFNSITRMNVEAIRSISYFDTTATIGDIKINGNYKSNKIKETNKKSQNNYRTNEDNLSFWIEKQITPQLKLGTIYSFLSSSTYMEEDNVYRDDYYYSGGIYAVYNYQSVILSSTLLIGGDYNHLNRYNQSQIGDFKNFSTNKNLFIGSNNLVYRKFDFKNFYITPKAELNIIELHQGKIEEEGNYGLIIDSHNQLSIEPGIGMNIGKDFFPSPTHKLSLNIEMMNYLEIANPYKNLDTRFKPLNSRFQIEAYHNDIDHTNVSFKESYQYLKTFKLEFSQDYTVSIHQKQFKYGVNITFIF